MSHRRIALWWRRLAATERGSVLVLAAFALTAVCAFAGLSLDVGNVLVEKRTLQNAVDAAALAASQQLPASTSGASADALTWMGKNGYGTGDTTVVGFSTTYAAGDTVTVTSNHGFPLILAPLFGKDETTVQASSKAVIGSMAGGDGLVPFGLLKNHNPCFSGGQPIYGASCTMKFGSGDGSDGGDFGPLSLDGNGGSAYRGTIANGSSSTWHIGDKVPTETGNMTGPTKQGLDDRIGREPTAGCGNGTGQDTFDEVFSLGPGGFYKLNCPTSPRVILVPVIDKLDNPNESTILDFALLYLEDFRFNGGHSEVTGRLVQVNISDPDVIFGAYHGNGLRMIKLIE